MRENRPSGSEAGVALIPPSLPLSNASRVRRHHAKSRQRMDCVGLPPLCEAGQGETWPSHWGGSQPSNGCYHHGWKQGTRFSSWRRAGARGKWWLRRRCSCSGSSKGGGTIGVRNGGRKRWAGERGMQAARRIRVRSSGPASFEVWPGWKLSRAWRPCGATSGGPGCFSGRAAPPKRSKN